MPTFTETNDNDPIPDKSNLLKIILFISALSSIIVLSFYLLYKYIKSFEKEDFLNTSWRSTMKIVTSEVEIL